MDDASVDQEMIKTIETKVDTHIVDEGLDVFFSPMFYPQEQTYIILRQLEKEIVWDMHMPKYSWQTISEEKETFFASQVAYGDVGFLHTLNNEAENTREWTPTLEKIRGDIFKALGVSFNFCLISRQKDLHDIIGVHLNNEQDLKLEASVVLISFGIPMDFSMKYQYENTNEASTLKSPKYRQYKVHLPNGSLVQLKASENNYWYQQLSAKANIKSKTRVTLTFMMKIMSTKKMRDKLDITSALGIDSLSATTSTEYTSDTISPVTTRVRRLQAPRGGRIAETLWVYKVAEEKIEESSDKSLVIQTSVTSGSCIDGRTYPGEETSIGNNSEVTVSQYQPRDDSNDFQEA